MRIIGITGGIGSGKSAVLDILKNKYKAVVYEADKLAHDLIKKDMPLYYEYVSLFGEEILDNEKELDHKKIAEIAFHDKEKLNRLNDIVHPAVKEYILSLIEKERSKGTEIFVIEAALLIQDGYKKICDEIWFIHVPAKVRIERLMASRGYSKEKCENIINKQPSSSYFYENADFIIENDGNFSELSEKISNLLQKCC